MAKKHKSGGLRIKRFDPFGMASSPKSLRKSGNWFGKHIKDIDDNDEEF